MSTNSSTRTVNTKLQLDIADHIRNLKLAGAAWKDFAKTVEQSTAKASAAAAKMNTQISQQQQRQSKTRLTQAQLDQQAMNRLHEQALREDATRTRIATQQRIAADRSMTRAHEQALRENAARDRQAAQATQRMNQLHSQALRENAARQAAADRAASAASDKRARDVEKVSKAAMVGGALLVAGWAVSVNAAMKFEKQISAVGAAAGATGKDLDALRQAALQAGADTAFTASEAAQGEEELAKAGVAVKDILSGGLRGALDLAAAGQLSVAESAEIAATAMTQFKLSGDKVPHIADLLSAGANKAQGDVHQLGMALKMGGLVASQFGWSVEETVGTLTMFAKAGLVGSDAGTSMKQMLLMLVNPTKKAANLMSELGIKTYDANGKFLSATGLAGQLQDKLGKLSEQERNTALATIFGADAIRGASIAFNNGAAGAQKWIDNVNDVGNASRTAAAKLDNLAGDVEKLKGSMEVAFIKTGQSSMGALRILTQAAGNMVNGFTAAPTAVQNTATTLAAVTGSALLAAGAYGVMAPKVRNASAALSGLGRAGQVTNTVLTKTAKYGGLALASIAVLQVTFAALAKSASVSGTQVDSFTNALREWGQTGKENSGISRVFTEDLKHLSYDLQTLNTGTGADWAKGFAGTIEGLTGLGGYFDESLQHAKERIADIDKALASLASNGHGDEAATAFYKLADAGRQNGISLEELRKGLPQYMGALDSLKGGAFKTGGSMADAGGKARVLAGGLGEAVHQAGSLDKALKSLNETSMSAFDAANAYQIGLNKLTEGLKENHHAFAGNTTAAVENRQMVGDLIKLAQERLSTQYEEVNAAKGQGAAIEATSASYKTMRTQIIAAAVAAGINKTAVSALVDALFQVPEETPAAVTTPGAEAAKARLEELKAQADAIVKTYIATITTHGTDTADAAINNAKGVAEEYDRTYTANFIARGTVSAAAQINNAKAVAEQYERTYAATIVAYGTTSAAASINQAKAAAERMERTYTANVVTKYSFSGSPPAANFGPNKRWGGVHSFAGGGIEAHVARNQLVRYAEPATGGEAFIPRLGDRARSMAILAEAASWYGAQVSTSASMAGAAMAPVAGSAGGSVSHYHFHLTAAPGADLRKAGQYMSEAIAVYESKGGRRP